MYTYKIDITKVYDGDTINGTVDLGFNLKMDIKVRLARINTPEIRTKDLDEKKRGYEARDFLRALLEECKGNIAVRTTFKGKYGRWVGEILIDASKYEHDSNIIEEYGDPFPLDRYINVNDILVQKGYAEYKEY